MQQTTAAALLLLLTFIAPLMEARTCHRDWEWVMTISEDKLNEAINNELKEVYGGSPSFSHQPQPIPVMNISMRVTGCTIIAIPGEK